MVQEWGRRLMAMTMCSGKMAKARVCLLLFITFNIADFHPVAKFKR